MPRPVSQRRLTANRQNVRKSTGPRTPTGKPRSARNSLSRGRNAIPVYREPARFFAYLQCSTYPSGNVRSNSSYAGAMQLPRLCNAKTTKKKLPNEPIFPSWRYRKRRFDRKNEPKRTQNEPNKRPKNTHTNPNEPKTNPNEARQPPRQHRRPAQDAWQALNAVDHRTSAQYERQSRARHSEKAWVVDM